MGVEWSDISATISDQIGYTLRLSNPQSIGGGCINQTWKVTDDKQQSWFIKLNKPSRQLMFDTELLGLEAIRASHSIRAPKPLCTGKTQQYSFLIMEHLKLQGSLNADETGAQLANMHQHSQTAFGWHMDNTIGATPQINTLDDSWINFWKEHRLGFQLKLAFNNGFPHHSYESGLALVELADQFFTTYQPMASLLHGDLWGGNCSGDDSGQPVIYDPAVYFGDRETDLAMTELFSRA